MSMVQNGPWPGVRAAQSKAIGQPFVLPLRRHQVYSSAMQRRASSAFQNQCIVTPRQTPREGAGGTCGDA